eukprot:gene16230-22396_t
MAAAPRPNASSEEALSLFKQLWDVVPEAADVQINVRQLDSYADRNFHVTSKDLQPGFVLKIHNSMDTENLPMLEGQHLAMRVLSAAGISCSQPIPSCASKDIEMIQLSCQAEGSLPRPQSHIMRCFHYLPGQLLDDVPLTPELLISVGKLMGRVSSALSEVQHTGLEREHEWHMEFLKSNISRRLQLMGDNALEEPKMKLIESVLKDWEAAEKTIFPSIPRQVCHTDCNEANIIVSQDGKQAASLIDFGDMCYSWAVSEVAIAMAYMMVLEQKKPDGDPMAVGALVLAGYCETCKHGALSEAEQEVLPLLIRGRIALSLVSGAQAAMREPENAQYLLRTQSGGWALLKTLDEKIAVLAAERENRTYLAADRKFSVEQVFDAIWVGIVRCRLEQLVTHWPRASRILKEPKM